jgi:hypothetical protein
MAETKQAEQTGTERVIKNGKVRIPGPVISKWDNKPKTESKDAGKRTPTPAAFVEVTGIHLVKTLARSSAENRKSRLKNLARTNRDVADLLKAHEELRALNEQCAAANHELKTANEVLSGRVTELTTVLEASRSEVTELTERLSRPKIEETVTTHEPLLASSENQLRAKELRDQGNTLKSEALSILLASSAKAERTRALELNEQADKLIAEANSLTQ